MDRLIVGDVCTYEKKIKLIVTGFGEALAAVNGAKVYIDPSSILKLMHSPTFMEKNTELLKVK